MKKTVILFFILLFYSKFLNAEDNILMTIDRYISDGKFNIRSQSKDSSPLENKTFGIVKSFKPYHISSFLLLKWLNFILFY